MLVGLALIKYALNKYWNYIQNTEKIKNAEHIYTNGKESFRI